MMAVKQPRSWIIGVVMDSTVKSTLLAMDAGSDPFRPAARERKKYIFRMAAIIAAALVLFCPGQVRSESASRLVSRGNGSFMKGNFDEASEYYEKASVKLPESPVIAFNLGNVSYRQGDYSRARSYFEEAALKSRDLSLEAKAWYNIGNCAFSEGERQSDSDLEKALESYRESVGLYAAALEKDPELKDAAHNMEIARLVIKDLLDRIKEQEEQMKEQQEKIKEVVDSLIAATERQEELLQRSLELQDDPGRAGSAWKNKVEKAGSDQAGIREATGKVLEKLGEIFPSEPPEPVVQASAHLDTAMVDQDDAGEDLDAAEPGMAAVDEEEGLVQMKKALQLLTQGDKGQQEQQGKEDKGEQKDKAEDQDQGQQDEQQPSQQKQPPRSETAKGILEEEKENRKKRKQQAAGGYKKVDKDW